MRGEYKNSNKRCCSSLLAQGIQRKGFAVVHFTKFSNTFLFIFQYILNFSKYIQ